MEKRRCRTCLEVSDARQCIKLTKKCYAEKTIKETLIMLVPEMVSTLFDEDSVCRTCYRVLKSSLKFIERCLEVELTIAEENKQFEDYDHLNGLFLDLPPDEASETDKQNFGDVANRKMNSEHNYCSKNDVGSVPVALLPETHPKASENSQQYDGPLICDSLLEANKDEHKDDIVIEHCDLLQESKIYDNLDSTANILEEEVMVSHQTSSDKFICKQCEKGFKTKLKYMQHLQIHKEHYTMLCDICGRFSKGDLEVHKSSHNNERPYMCHKCPKTFKTDGAYKKHEKLVHKRLNEKQCHECGLIFLIDKSYQDHYRIKHLGLKPFCCKICGKKFGRKDYLKHHMRTHTSEPRPGQETGSKLGRVNEFGFKVKHTGKPFTCKICGKQVSTFPGFRIHLQTHTKIKRYRCRHCNLAFTTSTGKNRHEKYHKVDYEKKFSCNICWKRAKTEEELEEHVLVHKSKPPKYSCDKCDEKFYSKYLLNNHHMNKHIGPEDIEKAEKEIVQNLMEYADTDL